MSQFQIQTLELENVLVGKLYQRFSKCLVNVFPSIQFQILRTRRGTHFSRFFSKINRDKIEDFLFSLLKKMENPLLVLSSDQIQNCAPYCRKLDYSFRLSNRILVLDQIPQFPPVSQKACFLYKTRIRRVFNCLHDFSFYKRLINELYVPGTVANICRAITFPIKYGSWMLRLPKGIEYLFGSLNDKIQIHC